MREAELERLLVPVRAAAERAGEAILGIYAGDFEVRRKSDSSPVTKADADAERLILPVLATLAPALPIVSEEAVEAGGFPRLVGGRFWLVDPLDGTKEFIARNGEFTVNIALIEDGRPVLGVVHLPALGLTYAGLCPEDGGGRALEAGAGADAHPIRARATPPEGAVVLASRSHGDSVRLAAFLAGLRISGQRVAGSALKFCVIAKGEADLYPRFGPTMEWDTAAGHAVLAAAGGTVETFAGEPLAYGKPGFVNGPFVARGRRA